MNEEAIYSGMVYLSRLTWDILGINIIIKPLTLKRTQNIRSTIAINLLWNDLNWKTKFELFNEVHKERRNYVQRICTYLIRKVSEMLDTKLLNLKSEKNLKMSEIFCAFKIKFGGESLKIKLCSMEGLGREQF